MCARARAKPAHASVRMRAPPRRPSAPLCAHRPPTATPRLKTFFSKTDTPDIQMIHARARTTKARANTHTHTHTRGSHTQTSAPSSNPHPHPARSRPSSSRLQAAQSSELVLHRSLQRLTSVSLAKSSLVGCAILSSQPTDACTLCPPLGVCVFMTSQGNIFILIISMKAENNNLSLSSFSHVHRHTSK